MSSSSSSSTKNRSAWANGRYDGGSAFGGTQPRLLPLGKKALVTPRASNPSSTAKQTKSKQVSLKSAFKRQQNAASRPSTTQQSTSKENRPPSQRALADGRSSSDDDNLLGAKEGRTAEQPGFFGRLYKAFAHTNDEDTSPSSAASSRQQSQSRPPKGIGKRILNPSASDKRRGPTIDFDASGEPPMDDDEMAGETQRRKRKRVQEGGRGQLDLVPADDFEGFGGRTHASGSSSRKRVKRELEMGEEEKPVMLELKDDSDEELDKRTEEPPEDSWDPEPSTRPDSVPAPASPSFNPSKRSYAESSQSDDDTLQQQLVPRRDDISVVLVPDSDDLVPDSEDEGMQRTDDECDRLAQSMGAGMADDSGYAEMEVEPEEEKGKDDSNFSLPVLPPSLASTNNRRRSVNLRPVDEDVPMGDEPVRDTQSPFPSLSADRTLGRTPSGILMPPPPLPRSRSSPRSNSSSGEKAVVRTTPLPTEAIPAVAEETQDDPPPAGPTVLVPDTQPQLNYHPIPAPPLLLSPNRVLCEETQFHPLPPPPVLASTSISSNPIASTSKLPPRSPTTPKRHTASTSAWDSLASAWAGQRPPSPPKPASPRQSRLNEFFRIPSRPSLDHENEDEETQLVEDSQPTVAAGFGGLTLEQMEAFRGAFNTTREMGRLARSGSKGNLEDVPEEEEIEEAMEVERVESSDSEECWSPLGSPVKKRFPTLALGGAGEGRENVKSASFDLGGEGSQGRRRQASASQFRSGSQGQRKSQEQSSSAEQRGVEQLAQLETQWESYWSEETYQPFVPLSEPLEQL
ncbi:hypothetical protein BCR35DRAFT_323289 [Leucosporidium creatinivorum]|uniref:Uncharacterized protein n=1 Tax=Leucosporidium creatinivorum TaxID=106004 RepID=A0A1Y2G250_9BASI|nr:hypothetical protein BCR35DRAFT_323289 [Leucosporidium creatinivorum]